MARYKDYNYGQTELVPVSFARQVLAGTFEYALSHLIDRRVDMRVFEARYRNDDTGAPAYDPAILLKIILYAYSLGITSSREIEALCRDNVVCMALSAGSCPHWTTIAGFVSSVSGEMVAVFRDVLGACDEAGLVGKQMFAVDGVKLPSNASKEWSGTREELAHKLGKLEQAVQRLVERHRGADLSQAAPTELAQRAAKQIETLNAAMSKIQGFLDTQPDKRARSGHVVKSNITDPDSAKIKTSKGVIQGYTGMALVDAQHQVIVAAGAFGEGQEHGLLEPLVQATRENFQALGTADVLAGAKLAADAGMHSEANLELLAEAGIDAYVADTQFRSRDARFADAARHKPQAPPDPDRRFGPKEFQVAEDFSHCICPAGKRLYRNGGNCTIGGRKAVKFTAPKAACRDCPLRQRCLRHPDRTPQRQVAIFQEQRSPRNPHTAQMKLKIDTEQGQMHYARRLAIVEPVFGNLRHNHELDRFSLRGEDKVNGQWLLFALVHNVQKLQRYSPWGTTGSPASPKA